MMGNQTDATLYIAVTGLALSVVSLTWQVVQHVLSGSRIKAFLKGGSLGPGGAVTGEVAKVNLAALAREGFAQPVLALEAVNVGRLPVNVTGWGIDFDGEFSFQQTNFSPNPSLPYRLEPGASVTFYCLLDDAIRGQSAFRAAVKSTLRDRVRGKVSLATGKTIYSNWTPRLPS